MLGELAGAVATFLTEAFELLSALTIALGLGLALRQVRDGVRAVQLAFARYLLLALEFLLAADILASLRAPTWEDILQLGAVALIRTGLDYYLSRDLRQEERRPIAGDAGP
jgi:uncharacterized membrane protein